METILNRELQAIKNEREEANKYQEFENAVVNSFKDMVSKDTPLFTTEVSNLWDLYLNNLPEDQREHYNCNACRHFVNRFGGLVIITEDGNTKSVLWNIESPKFFENAVNALRREVESATISGVFASDSKVLGIPKTGSWSHLHAELPRELVNKSRVDSASQIMAKRKEEYGMLNRALVGYKKSTVETAVNLLKTETLYRGDQCLAIAEWFLKLMNDVPKSHNGRNITWSAVAKAPAGFCHIKSGMIGTLLDDIEDGLDYNLITRRFAEKMSPENYMRSQAAPTENQIEQAEKLVEKLGIADSLERRYAKYDEIPNFIWEAKESKTLDADKPKTSGGVFGSVKSKEQINNTSTSTEMAMPTTVMTWDKFKRTVLPTADSVEVKIDNTNRLMALVNAVHPDAENILKWNNTFSWYYHGGVDAEMKRRVIEAGGQHENNVMRCSLMWEGFTDLDLHCITPRREHMYYNSKRSSDGGYLDLDMNGIDKKSSKPVENMRWSHNPTNGHYKFYVYNYSERTNMRKGTGFKAELEVNGEVFTYEGAPLRDSDRQTIFEFDYINGKIENFVSDNASSTGTVSEDWNVALNTFVPVKGITTSPNLWDEENPVIGAGTHTFFLLENCQDSSEGKGRGFFNEMLKSELKEIRKVLESYTANTPIEDAHLADACGVGYSKDKEWNLIVRVKSNNATRLIKIDRWD